MDLLSFSRWVLEKLKDENGGDKPFLHYMHSC
jgi:hypothetical protein